MLAYRWQEARATPRGFDASLAQRRIEHVEPVPGRLGRHRIIEVIGKGGMAEILLAERLGARGFKQQVVLKRLLPHLSGNPDFVTSLIDEARIVSRINHKNVVRIFDLEREGDQIYLVMEYVEGRSLLELLKSAGGALDFGLAAHVIAEACSGLHAAHEQGIVHRDVTPSNVLISTAGEVRVVDFGIATCIDRLTETRRGLLKGKFAYFAPERIEGRSVDRRADVYCLGIVLWELTLRRRLFKRGSDVACLQAILGHEVPRPSHVISDYPPELERIVLRALAHDRDLRYGDTAEMARELRRFTLAQSNLQPEESLAAIVSAVVRPKIEVREPTAPSILVALDEELPTLLPPPQRGTQEILAPKRTRAIAALALVATLVFGGALMAARTEPPPEAPIRIEPVRAQVVPPVVIDTDELIEETKPAQPSEAPKPKQKAIAKPKLVRARPKPIPKPIVAPPPEEEPRYERFD